MASELELLRTRAMKFEAENATLRRRIAEMDRAASGQLRFITDHLPIYIAHCDSDRRYRFVNRAYAERLGFSVEDVIGRRIPEIVGDEAYSAFRSYVDEALSGRSVEIEMAIPYREIGVHFMRIAYIPDIAQDGRVKGFVATIADITDRKRAEEALRESEARLRALVEASAQVVWTANPNGSVVEDSPSWRAFTGQTYEEWKDFGWLNAVHPGDRDRIMGLWRESAENRIVLSAEYRIRQAGGEWRWTAGRAVPLESASGQLKGWISTNTDIHDHKDAEEALRKQLRLTETITNNAAVSLFILDEHQQCVFMNPSATKLTGYTLEEVQGRPLHDVIHHTRPDGSHYPTSECPIDRAFPQNNQEQGEEVFVHKDGHFYAVAYAASPLREGEEIRGTIIELRDITAGKAAEAELRRTNEDLRRANHDLEQFAYSASHDLQEPLRNISIYSELLRRRYADDLDGQAEEFLGYLVESARRTGQLIDGLLAYTQIPAGTGESADAVDSNQSLLIALSNLEPAIESGGAVITRSPLPNLQVEAAHLEQVFRSLIGNSLKYQKNGERPRIDISVERADDDWIFAVKDNGIGIEPRYQAQIFGLFKRLHTSEKYAGTGIGLALCRKIVEHYGGSIWVESELGRGSTFYFSLPARLARSVRT